MRKTRSLIGKTLLAALVLLMISIPFLTTTSALYVDQLPGPTVYMDPFRIQGNTGDDVVVYMRIADVLNSGGDKDGPLFTFQAGLKWDNTTAVSCSAVEDGGFLGSNGGTPISFPGSIDNVNGIVTPYGYFLTDTTKAAFGNGALIKFTFHMLATGYSDVHITDFIPMTIDGVTEMQVKTIDYFTAAVAGGHYVVKVVGNAEGTDARFSGHSVTEINTVINSVTYKGNLTFTITSPDAFSQSWQGFVNVTIPKAMMDCAVSSHWLLYLNGNLEGSRVVTSNATHVFVFTEFTYNVRPSDRTDTEHRNSSRILHSILRNSARIGNICCSTLRKSNMVL